MPQSYAFLKGVIDAITEHIVVIDSDGTIQFVNESWVAFGRNNAYPLDSGWQGVNYLDVCAESAALGEAFAEQAATGIRQVISRQRDLFYLEYPCHSPDEQRWFMMRVTPLRQAERDAYVICHQNITERKLAEEAALQLSRIDGLTQIANRRHFDEFLQAEWRRCARLQQPISLALLDLDHFKQLNDRYGHPVGDECLVKIGALLSQFVKRPGDLCARYGGEEFVLVFGNTPLAQARRIMMRLMEAIRALGIPNQDSSVGPGLTASIGLAEQLPAQGQPPEALLRAADSLLLAAKSQGRDRLLCAPHPDARPQMPLMT